ncbi:unnamed protein product, partial [Rotaria magnacalcarata]
CSSWNCTDENHFSFGYLTFFNYIFICFCSSLVYNLFVLIVNNPLKIGRKCFLIDHEHNHSRKYLETVLVSSMNNQPSKISFRILVHYSLLVLVSAVVNYILLWCLKWLTNGYELNCIRIYKWNLQLSSHTVFAYRSITIKCVLTSINSNNVISCQIIFYFSFLNRLTKGQESNCTKVQLTII